MTARAVFHGWAVSVSGCLSRHWPTLIVFWPEFASLSISMIMLFNARPANNTSAGIYQHGISEACVSIELARHARPRPRPRSRAYRTWNT
jgi:hypothetical protein